MAVQATLLIPSSPSKLTLINLFATYYSNRKYMTVRINTSEIKAMV